MDKYYKVVVLGFIFFDYIMISKNWVIEKYGCVMYIVIGVVVLFVWDGMVIFIIYVCKKDEFKVKVLFG